jgi:hypothetical protein
VLRRKVAVWISISLFLGISIQQFQYVDTNNADERLVVVFVRANKGYADEKYEKRAGSVDALRESSGNLSFSGWISPDIDEIHVVVSANSSQFVQRLQLLTRPDVQESMANSQYLYSGFETVLPEISLLQVKCVVFANEQKSQLVYNSGTSC